MGKRQEKTPNNSLEFTADSPEKLSTVYKQKLK